MSLRSCRHTSSTEGTERPPHTSSLRRLGACGARARLSCAPSARGLCFVQPSFPGPLKGLRSIFRRRPEERPTWQPGPAGFSLCTGRADGRTACARCGSNRLASFGGPSWRFSLSKPLRCTRSPRPFPVVTIRGSYPPAREDELGSTARARAGGDSFVRSKACHMAMDTTLRWQANTRCLCAQCWLRAPSTERPMRR